MSAGAQAEDPSPEVGAEAEQEALRSALDALMLITLEEENTDRLIFPLIQRSRVVSREPYEVTVRYRQVVVTVPVYRNHYEEVEMIVPVREGSVTVMRQVTRRVLVRREQVGERRVERLVADPDGPIERTHTRHRVTRGPGLDVMTVGWLGNNSMALYALLEAGVTPDNAPVINEMANSISSHLSTYGLPDDTYDLAWATAALSRYPGQFYRSDVEALTARLLSGQCDIATQDGLDITRAPLLLEGEATGVLDAHFAFTPVFEHIDFGLVTAPGFAETRPAWFTDIRVRQAMIHCTNRQRMVDEIFYGLSEVADTMVPSTHPLYPEGITVYDYDPALGREILEEAGVIDRDLDGVREEPRVRNPLRFTLIYATGSVLREQVLTIFQENMEACGIEVTLSELPPPELYDTSGPLFGRRFDLAAFPWISGMTPPCDLYTTAQIPFEETNWQGNNNTGFSNELYDEACQAATQSLWYSESFRTNHQAAMRILADNLPIIPLFPYVNVAASRLGVEGVQLDPTQPSELWNIYELDVTSP